MRQVDRMRAAPWVLIWGLAWGGPAAATFDLAALMASLRAVPALVARFDEVKTVGLLNTPLELSGWLEYRAPDHLTKTVTEPFSARYELDGDFVRMSEPELGERELRLQDLPYGTALAASLRATLAGDLDTLQHHYQTELHGTLKAWHLTLTPQEPGLGQHLLRVELGGSEARVTRIEQWETDGDHAVLTVLPTP